jgi:hypothetical protein
MSFQVLGVCIRRCRATTTPRRIALRYISSEPSTRPPSLFEIIPLSSDWSQLLGPSTVPHPSGPFLDQIISGRKTCYLRRRDPCLDFYSGFRFGRPEHVSQSSLELSWSHCPWTTLKLICLLRRRNLQFGREMFYTAALWLHRHHSKTLAHNVKAFAQFGCLKDLLEILYRILNGPKVRHNQIMERNRVRTKRQHRLITKRMASKAVQKRRRKQHNRLHLLVKGMKSKVMQNRRRELQKRWMRKRMNSKEVQKRKVVHLRKEKRVMMTKMAIERYNCDTNYRFLHDKISSLFAELVKADLEYLVSGQLTKISLASKWCPSLDSSYDRSTLFCEKVARRLFPYDSCTEYRGIDESHYLYRVRDRLRKEYLVPLRRALELPEIYMSVNQWNVLQYDRVRSYAMKTYNRLFYKHDRERFMQYLHNVKCFKMPKTTIKELQPYEILDLFGYVSDHEVELQWKKMIDNYSKKGKFMNCISVVDDKLFHEGYARLDRFGCIERFSLAFVLMTSELCPSPLRGKVLTSTTSPEFVNIKGDDLGSKINFLRNQPVVFQPPGLIQLLDKILETAIDLKLSRENMIERIFMLEISIDGTWFGGWEKNSRKMREKFERNGYVIPKIVRWNLWCGSPEVHSIEGGGTEISGFSKASMKIFLEGDGTLSPMAAMESEICSKEYLKLVVYD